MKTYLMIIETKKRKYETLVNIQKLTVTALEYVKEQFEIMNKLEKNSTIITFIQKLESED